jgi:hypothetical protein
MVTSVKMPLIKVPLLGYGKVFSIEIDHIPPNARHYQVTIGNFPSCSYLDFVKMSMVALCKRGNGCLATSLLHLLSCHALESQIGCVHSLTHFEF